MAGVLEAQALAPAAFSRIANTYLQWCSDALGTSALERAVDAFADFSSAVNLAQGRYELAGHYEHKSYDECRRSVYDDHASMTDYLWGVYLSNFLWAHHLELMIFFEERFLSKVMPGARIVEIAPGHGGWGLWALNATTDTRLTGYDISATSKAIATRLAVAADLSDRADYVRRDALQLSAEPSPQAQVCICCFLVEHLEQPSQLLDTISHVLAPAGYAFFTGALTAAQIDHIYEFRCESELVLLGEQAGLRTLETRSVSPNRRLKNAKFLPRSMALVMQKRTSANW